MAVVWAVTVVAKGTEVEVGLVGSHSGVWAAERSHYALVLVQE